MDLVTDLWLGDWRDVLCQRDVESQLDECDVVITDPPFSKRTEEGFRGLNSNPLGDPFARGIPYGSIDEVDVKHIADFCADRARWFSVIFTDHVLIPAFEEALKERNLYTFAPIPWIKTDAPPRFLGDGPASMTEWILVARRRRRIPKERCGSRPGYYITRMNPDAKGRAPTLRGQKPVNLIRALIRDYSLSGDLVVDLYAGSGTTLVASRIEGRHSIGVEIDPATYDAARARLDLPEQGDLFVAAAAAGKEF